MSNTRAPRMLRTKHDPRNGNTAKHMKHAVVGEFRKVRLSPKPKGHGGTKIENHYMTDGSDTPYGVRATGPSPWVERARRHARNKVAKMSRRGNRPR